MNRSIKILELVNYRKDNGEKTRSPPLDSRERVIRTKKDLSSPTPYSLPSPFLHLAKVTQLIVDRNGCRGKNQIKSKVAQLVESPDKGPWDSPSIAYRRSLYTGHLLSRCPPSYVRTRCNRVS